MSELVSKKHEKLGWEGPKLGYRQFKPFPGRQEMHYLEHSRSN